MSRALAALGLADPRLRGLLLLLWGTTAAYVGAHLSHRFFGMPWSPAFDLGEERGYAEVFFQTLTAWSIVLLVVAAVRRRAGILIIFAIFTAYLLADDYFQIHERIGTWFGFNVLYVGLLSPHLGEGFWLASIGVLLSASFAIAYRFARPESRRIALTVAAVYAVLAFFGVIIDAIHSPFIDMPVIDPIMIAVEDGGEIAVMSVLVVYLMSLAFPLAVASPQPAERSQQSDSVQQVVQLHDLLTARADADR